MRLRRLLVRVLPSLLLTFAPVLAWAADLSVAGRVVRSGGAPLEGAEVVLYASPDPLARARLTDTGALPKAAARAVTDAAGAFRLAAPGPGSWRVRVQAPGFVPVECGLEPLVEPVELPDAALVSDDGLTVKVSDGEGRPVKGARVLLAPPRDRWARMRGDFWITPPRTAMTDEKGAARLAHAEKESSMLAVAAPGYPVQDRKDVRGTAAAVTLRRGDERNVIVRAAGGAPVPGALVTAGEARIPVGFTDAKGRFLLSLPQGASLAVSVVTEDGRSADGPVEAPAADAALAKSGSNAPASDASSGQGGSKPVTVTGLRANALGGPRTFLLPERQALPGRVLDARDRRAVQGAVVWLEDEPWSAAVTDRAGGYTIRASAGRQATILAGAAGYMRPDPVNLTPAADIRRGPTFALKPAAAIEGIVLDEAGRPVPGAEASLDIKASGERIMIRIGRESLPTRAVTSSRGTFRLSPVDPSNNYDLKISARGYARETQPVFGLEPGETRSGLRLVLNRGLIAKGLVTDGGGKPIREAAVTLSPSKRAGAGHGGMVVLDPSEQTPKGTKTATDNDGRFSIGGLAASSYDLEIRRPGFATKTVAGIEIASRAEPADLGSFTMEPGQRLQGLVSAPDGGPIEGVEISIAPGGGGIVMMMGPATAAMLPAAAVTGPDGRFALDDLKAGDRLNLSFRRTGYVDARESGVEVPHPEPLEIKLVPSSKVKGTVFRPDGKPVPGAEVGLTRSATGGGGGEMVRMIMRENGRADDEGRFTFEGVRPGPISLSASCPACQEGKIDSIEVPSGQDLENVEIRLKAGAVVAGRVTAPDGRGAAGARISTVSDEPDEIKFGGQATDGDGYYRLEGLAPGKVAIEATHDDYVRTVKEIDARPGSNTLNLQFEGGQEVSGRVIDPGGAPVAGASLSLVSSAREWGGPEGMSGADGTFRIAGVADGDYKVFASREGYAPSRGDVSVKVAGKGVPDLVVKLGVGGVIAGTVKGIEPEKVGQVAVRGDNPAKGTMASASPDAQGNYRLVDLVPGNWVVTASHADSGRQTRGEIQLEPGQAEARLDLEFGAGLTLSGRAVAGDLPVKGATVYATGDDVNRSGFGRTAEDGSFRIEGLEPGAYNVELRQWETGLSYDEKVDLGASRDITLRVPTTTLAGRVLDAADRRPVAGATVTVTKPGDSGPAAFSGRSATTDLSGKFRIANVADGGWTLTVGRRGYAAKTLDVNVENGHDQSDLSVELDPTEGLSLEVKLSSGRPPDSAEIAVLDDGGRALTSGTFSTGENGRIRLTSVPAGNWTVLVGAAGAGTVEMRATAPGPPLAVLLPPACALRVKIPALAGSPTAARATVRGADGRPYREVGWMSEPMAEWRLVGGQVGIDAIPPGSWNVTVSAADGRTWQGTAITTAGNTAELSLE